MKTKYEIDIFFFFGILAKWRKKILFFVIIGIILGISKSIFTPIEYKSRAVALLPSFSFNDKVRANSAFFLRYVHSQAVISMILSNRMREDITRHFDLINRPEFQLKNIISFSINNIIIVTEVRGTDPELTEKIANFCIFNIHDINESLKITTERSSLKMLDPAVRGIAVTNDIAKGVISGGLFAFIFSIIAAFSSEYLLRLKKA